MDPAQPPQPANNAVNAVGAAVAQLEQQHQQDQQADPPQHIAVNENSSQGTGSQDSTQPSTPCSASSGTSFGSSSSDGVECFGNERHTLAEQAKYCNSSVLSDIKLKVGGRTYHAHKLMLVRSSEVFERMFSSEWSDRNKQEVELVEEPCCVDSFPRFLKYLYSCHVTLNIDNTLPILILADKYNVCDLRNVCVNYATSFIIPKLQLKDVFHVWFQYATKCYHKKLIASCVMALSPKADDIMWTPEWDHEWLDLEKDQLIEIIKSSELNIKDEYSLYLALVKWLQASKHPDRQDNMESLLKELLQYIRFPMMTANQLCEVEKSSLTDQYPGLFNPYLMTSYKYHALSLESRGAMKEFTTSNFLLRNYTEIRWDKRIIISSFSQFSRCSELMRRFSTRSSTFPITSWDWELKIHPKGFSTSMDDFRVILYSNLILDQPRPIEFMLSIVDSNRLLKCVTGKKNFSKTRYTADTEIDKKVSGQDLACDSDMLVNDNLILQIVLKPVE
ncbi:BTB/POZ domain-containing protein 17-like [Glandiceps talaboti]